MKGKRYTTEDKIRILREADRGERTIQVICREANISEVTFHRWKRQFGQMDINRGAAAQRVGAGEPGAEADAGGVTAQKPGLGGRMRKKAVSPASRRALVQAAVEDGLCSQRKACQFLKRARSTLSYRGRPPTAKEELIGICFLRSVRKPVMCLARS